MVREVSGDMSAGWPEPFKAGKTPEPPTLPPFSKENAYEWLSKLQEFMKWGIDNWNDPDVQGKVTEMIKQIVNEHFTGSNYDMSIEELRDGLNVPKTSQKFADLPVLVALMKDCEETDPEYSDINKETLEEMVKILDYILVR